MKDLKEMGAWETFKALPNRVLSLLFNMISRWGIMLLLTTALVYFEKLNSMESVLSWIVFSFLFLFKTDGVEMLSKLADAFRKTKGE